MITLQFNNNIKITFDEIFQGLEQLNSSDFDLFVSKVLDLKSKRKNIESAIDEKRLIQEITEELTEQEQNRLSYLQEKLASTPLDETENNEMKNLINRIDALHFQRIIAVGKLAKLRKQPIDKIMEEFGFEHVIHHG